MSRAERMYEAYRRHRLKLGGLIPYRWALITEEERDCWRTAAEACDGD